MVSKDEFQRANRRAKKARSFPSAIAARYDRATRKIIIALSSGVELSFPADSAEGLENAKPSQLAEIEITPSGLGIHFPKLDADLYIPALLEGLFGSTRWMAARLGASGGKSKSPAKASAARANGKLGGRPKKTTAA